MMQDAVMEERELTVDGAGSRVYDKNTSASSLLLTSRRWSKSAALPAGEAVQEVEFERIPAAGEARPEGGRHADMRWQP
jgi:hypothetical protein